jgi:Spy/CpxP family protein refolding chaperone
MTVVLIAAITLASALPSLGTSQDTVRASGRVGAAGRDTTRRVRRDSVRFLIPRDSVRWPADTAHWIVSDFRFSRSGFDTVRYLEGRRGAMPISYQNGNASFAQHLFAPELVMQHQTRLKLTEQQRTAIVQEINRLQTNAVNVQWRVAEESEKLSELLSQDAVSETAALEQVNKVIEFETAVKRAQLSMLIRIRNVLTAEQRAILRNLQKPAR